MDIYIYGAGRVGRLTEELLAKRGIHIKGFIDVNADNLRVKNYKILRPDEIEVSEKVEIIVALAMKNVAGSVMKSLRDAGHKNVVLYSDRQLRDMLCVQENAECTTCLFVRDCQQDRRSSSNICLNSLSINVTTACSLNCRYCLALVPAAKKAMAIKNLDVKKFAYAINVLEQHIDEINEYSIVGGEPLLNKDLCAILDVLLNSSIQYKVINILTNGTVPIKEELMGLLKEYCMRGIRITIDNYGPEKLTDKAYTIIQANIEKLRENGCDYAVIDNTNGTWYDYGGFEDRKLSDIEQEERFAQCVTGDCIVLTPECYIGKCGRHMSMISVFGGALDDTEYIDLLNDALINNKEMLKRKLVEIINAKTLTACNHCNGFDRDGLVSAGEQEYI